MLNSGERGKVVDIGLRSTRILTRDDVLISVPNSLIVSTKIVNESAPDRKLRVRIKVSVSYSSDVDQVEETLIEVARANPLVLAEPQPRVRFRAFGDSSLDFELLCWTAQPKDKGRLITNLTTQYSKSSTVLESSFRCRSETYSCIRSPARSLNMSSTRCLDIDP